MLIGIDASRATVERPTGTELYSWRLINGLLEMAGERGHRIRLYLRDAPPPGHFRSAEHAELRAIPFPRLWTHVRLSWEMLTRPPGVLWIPAHVLPPVHPRRSVVTVHDLGYLYFPAAHRRLDRLYLDASTRWNTRQAERIIADTQMTRDDLVGRYGVPREKIAVVYPGIDEAVRRIEQPEVTERARQALGLLRRPYILYVGTLQPRKNLVRLVRAFATLAAEWPGDLVLAGKKGWLYDEIFAEVRARGLEGRVHFPGYVPAEDLPALLSGAAAFAYPSLYEGFGFPILEAMACGTPVVCARSSCLPEVAGGAALLHDPLDEAEMAAALRRVLTDAALRADLIARGQVRCREFSWDRAAREVLAVLEGVGR